jgi:hypothetical protein
MDKLRSTLKQFVRDWSAEVGGVLISGVRVDALLNLPGARREGGMLQANERCPSAPLFRRSRPREVRRLRGFHHSVGPSNAEVAFACSFLALGSGDWRTMLLDWVSLHLNSIAIHQNKFVVGFTCQGNEFSHYMLLSSHFILNR